MKAKIIFECRKAICVLQKTYGPSLYSRHCMENNIVTSAKVIHQRKKSEVVCQHSYDKFGNSCKSAVAVRKAKSMFECWKAICVIQKTYGSSLYSRYYMERNIVKSTKVFYQRKKSEVVCQHSYDNFAYPVNLLPQLGMPKRFSNVVKQSV